MSRARDLADGTFTGTITADGLTVTQTGSTTATIGATGTSGDNDGTLIINNGGTGDGMLRFDYETNTDRARIGVTTSSQDLIVYTAGSEKARILSGGGITFNGDTAAANALDDYEEGTWTPTLVGSTSSSGQSYAVNEGDYTKIGNQVFCRFGLTMSVAGSFSGYIQLSGLPFNIENNPPTVHLGNLYFVNGGQNVLSVGLQGYEGSNRIYLWIKTTASGSREYPGSAFITNNLQLTGSFTYQTTS